MNENAGANVDNNTLSYLANGDNIEYETKSTYYKMSVQNYTFQILQEITGNTMIYHVVDSKGKGCVRIAIDVDDPASELLLSGLSYRDSCSVYTPLARGLGTIAMIKAALIFVMKMHPNEEYVVLTDASKFDCVIPGDNTYISLPLHEYSFIVYGKTWYQRMFGAIPDDAKLLQEMQTCLEQMHAPLPNTCEELISIKTSNISKRSNLWVYALHADVNKLFIRMKEAQASCFEFLHEVFSRESAFARKHAEHSVCAYYRLVKINLTIPNFFNSHWKIPRSAIESYAEYSIEPTVNSEPIHEIHHNIPDNARMSYLFNITPPVYTVRGGGTRRAGATKEKRYISGYGGLHGYLATPKRYRIYSLKRKYTARRYRVRRNRSKRDDAIDT